MPSGPSFSSALAAAPPILDLAFDAGTLHEVRAQVRIQTRQAGLPDDRAVDVVLAVHELAANAVRHGAGAGQLEMSVRDGRLHCQVSDVGPPRVVGQWPVTGIVTAQPWPVQRGHGLWIVQATADQVTVAWGSAGSQVTAVFALPGGIRPA